MKYYELHELECNFYSYLNNAFNNINNNNNNRKLIFIFIFILLSCHF